MSQEDIKILQAFSEAFNRRDFDDATQYMDPPSKSIPASWLQTTTRNCAAASRS